MLAETEILATNTDDTRMAESFLERTCDIINAGAQAVMISIGHRAGLFDVMSRLEHETSQQIADAAELNERYVREWLAVMVTAGIVNYEPGNKTYQLPKAHAACLTRDAELGNVAVLENFKLRLKVLVIPEGQAVYLLDGDGIRLLGFDHDGSCGAVNRRYAHDPQGGQQADNDAQAKNAAPALQYNTP